jgi:transposase
VEHFASKVTPTIGTLFSALQNFQTSASRQPQDVTSRPKTDQVWFIISSSITLTSYSIMRQLSTDKRDGILSLLQQGLSTRKVAKRCRIGKSAVQRLRAECLPDLISSQNGRPAKLSAQDRRFCVRAITSGKLGTTTEVAKDLESKLNVKVCDRTVRNVLHEAGLGAVEKEEKPKLSPKNVKARLEFARSHRYWTVEDWKGVIWSDETKISRFCSDGRSWCWVRDGEGRQPHHVKETVKHGGGSIMIWGCMTAHGPGFMCRIEGTMDQHLYKQILGGELLQTISWYGMNINEVIFQHDNDPKHKARSVQEWLNEQPFDVLPWPPQSPDLNPIEHLWALLKRRLNQYERPPNGMAELWERVQEQWEKIDKEACLRLIESMPRRIAAVLKAKGRWTDY